jgi:hypothetical protein
VTLASRRTDIRWKKNQVGKDNPNFSGGRYIDDKGYIRVLRPDHPFNNVGYVYEHRLVAEKHLGRYLQTWETVHHINEIKLDNRWENFYLTTVPEHSAIHREGKRQSKERRDTMRQHAKRRNKESGRKGGKFS